MTERLTLSDIDQRLLFRHARTHGAWQPIDVSDDLLAKVYDLAKWGPTAFNSAPMRVIFVKSAVAKERLKPFLSPGNVEKTMTAPVTAILGWDDAFYDKLPTLLPHADVKPLFTGNAELARTTAFRNASMQAGYFIMAARGLGLDCGPMSGFDADGVKGAFLADLGWTPNMLCNLGYGDPTKLHPRNPRLSFEDVAKII